MNNAVVLFLRLISEQSNVALCFLKKEEENAHAHLVFFWRLILGDRVRHAVT